MHSLGTRENNLSKISSSVNPRSQITNSACNSQSLSNSNSTGTLGTITTSTGHNSSSTRGTSSTASTYKPGRIKPVFERAIKTVPALYDEISDTIFNAKALWGNTTSEYRIRHMNDQVEVLSSGIGVQQLNSTEGGFFQKKKGEKRGGGGITGWGGGQGEDMEYLLDLNNMGNDVGENYLEEQGQGADNDQNNQKTGKQGSEERHFLHETIIDCHRQAFIKKNNIDENGDIISLIKNNSLGGPMSAMAQLPGAINVQPMASMLAPLNTTNLNQISKPSPDSQPIPGAVANNMNNSLSHGTLNTLNNNSNSKPRLNPAQMQQKNQQMQKGLQNGSMTNQNQMNLPVHAMTSTAPQQMFNVYGIGGTQKNPLPMGSIGSFNPYLNPESLLHCGKHLELCKTESQLYQQMAIMSQSQNHSNSMANSPTDGNYNNMMDSVDIVNMLDNLNLRPIVYTAIPTPHLESIVFYLKLRHLLKIHAACSIMGDSFCNLRAIIMGMHTLTLSESERIAGSSGSSGYFDEMMRTQDWTPRQAISDLYEQIHKSFGKQYNNFMRFIASCDPRKLPTARSKASSISVTVEDMEILIDETFLAYYATFPYRTHRFLDLFQTLASLGLPIPWAASIPGFFGNPKQDLQLMTQQNDMNQTQNNNSSSDQATGTGTATALSQQQIQQYYNAQRNALSHLFPPSPKFQRTVSTGAIELFRDLRISKGTRIVREKAAQLEAVFLCVHLELGNLGSYGDEEDQDNNQQNQGQQSQSGQQQGQGQSQQQQGQQSQNTSSSNSPQNIARYPSNMNSTLNGGNSEQITPLSQSASPAKNSPDINKLPNIRNSNFSKDQLMGTMPQVVPHNYHGSKTSSATAGTTLTTGTTTGTQGAISSSNSQNQINLSYPPGYNQMQNQGGLGPGQGQGPIATNETGTILVTPTKSVNSPNLNMNIFGSPMRSARGASPNQHQNQQQNINVNNNRDAMSPNSDTSNSQPQPGNNQNQQKQQQQQLPVQAQVSQNTLINQINEGRFQAPPYPLSPTTGSGGQAYALVGCLASITNNSNLLNRHHDYLLGLASDPCTSGTGQGIIQCQAVLTAAQNGYSNNKGPANSNSNQNLGNNQNQNQINYENYNRYGIPGELPRCPSSREYNRGTNTTSSRSPSASSRKSTAYSEATWLLDSQIRNVAGQKNAVLNISKNVDLLNEKQQVRQMQSHGNRGGGHHHHNHSTNVNNNGPNQISLSHAGTNTSDNLTNSYATGADGTMVGTPKSNNTLNTMNTVNYTKSNAKVQQNRQNLNNQNQNQKQNTNMGHLSNQFNTHISTNCQSLTTAAQRGSLIDGTEDRHATSGLALKTPSLPAAKKSDDVLKKAMRESEEVYKPKLPKQLIDIVLSIGGHKWVFRKGLRDRILLTIRNQYKIPRMSFSKLIDIVNMNLDNRTLNKGQMDKIVLKQRDMLFKYFEIYFVNTQKYMQVANVGIPSEVGRNPLYWKTSQCCHEELLVMHNCQGGTLSNQKGGSGPGGQQQFRHGNTIFQSQGHLLAHLVDLDERNHRAKHGGGGGSDSNGNGSGNGNGNGGYHMKSYNALTRHDRCMGIPCALHERFYPTLLDYESVHNRPPLNGRDTFVVPCQPGPLHVDHATQRMYRTGYFEKAKF